MVTVVDEQIVVEKVLVQLRQVEADMLFAVLNELTVISRLEVTAHANEVVALHLDCCLFIFGRRLLLLLLVTCFGRCL